MARKAISDATQNNVLIKSRRRCCLCFWLEGKDEVMKGQIAHLDQSNENDDEDNLAFLCLNHHDEYDGRTSVTKGLREAEVRRWRDELYREMEYRFRTVKKYECQLTIETLLCVDLEEEMFCLRLRLTNTGENPVRSPTITMQLPRTFTAWVRKPHKGEKPMFELRPEYLERWRPLEEQLNVFEENGRVMVKRFGQNGLLLMPGHVLSFDALRFKLADHPLDSEINLIYRVDYEEGLPSQGTLQIDVDVSGSTLMWASDDD